MDAGTLPTLVAYLRDYKITKAVELIQSWEVACASRDDRFSIIEGLYHGIRNGGIDDWSQGQRRITEVIALLSEKGVRIFEGWEVSDRTSIDVLTTVVRFVGGDQEDLDLRWPGLNALRVAGLESAPILAAVALNVQQGFGQPHLTLIGDAIQDAERLAAAETVSTQLTSTDRKSPKRSL